MSLLQPWYLWALPGLVIPLAIHLLSRKEGRLIRMGSLRHIRETSSRQFKSIRLNEYVLLALRSIVVILMVLLMSGWYLNDLKDSRKWLILEHGLESDSRVSALCDSLRRSGYEERYLLPGFPALDEKQEKPTQPDYSARLEELQREVVDMVVVIATNRVRGFTGERIALSPEVRWISLTPAPQEFVVAQVLTGGDSLFVRTGHSSDKETSYTTKITPNGSSVGKALGVIRVVIASDENFISDRKIVLAALQAMRKAVPEEITIEAIASSSPVPEADWLIWLSSLPPPKTSGGLVYFDEQSGGPLLIDKRSGKIALTARLNSEVAITNNLTLQLMRRIVSSEDFLEAAQLNDVRSVADNMAWRKTIAGIGPVITERGNEVSTQYLLIALLGFIVLERLLSYHRNQ